MGKQANRQTGDRRQETGDRRQETGDRRQDSIGKQDNEDNIFYNIKNQK
jgi:hypothetical protein